MPLDVHGIAATYRLLNPNFAKNPVDVFLAFASRDCFAVTDEDKLAHRIPP